MKKRKTDKESKGRRKRARKALYKYKREQRMREIPWGKLDNSAHLFPIISNEDVSNVYRVAVILSENVDGKLLQRALDKVLPKFNLMNCRLRAGAAWYYFEKNGKPAPSVHEENDYPCLFINQDKNRSYMFRVTYFERRINLEAFHVLTDGMGAFLFLKELVYQYLRLAHPALREKHGDDLAQGTSLNLDDSYLENFQKINISNIYKNKKAYLIRGFLYTGGKISVMHGVMNVVKIKEAAGRYAATINEYLVSALIWAIYMGSLGGRACPDPISINVPVNLRPYFNSVSTRNFFIMVAARFCPERDGMSFSEVAEQVKESLREQITKEHLQDILSHNVTAEKIGILRSIPLVFKKIGLRVIYKKNAKSNTATLTNLGEIRVESDYAPYIENFNALLSRSKWQNLKVAVVTYNGMLTATVTSALRDVHVQREFFRFFASEGIDVRLTTNGIRH